MFSGASCRTSSAAWHHHMIYFEGVRIDWLCWLHPSEINCALVVPFAQNEGSFSFNGPPMRHS
eukprot:403793-Prorocentrum_lima.AAC.1